MFGLQNFGTWSAYLLCILSVLACILYGIFNWNKGENEEDQIKQGAQWQKDEIQIEDDL